MPSGAGAGAFAASFGKSLTDVLMQHRAVTREEQRRKEDRAYEVERYKFQTMFPYMIENIDQVDDESLKAEFPTLFGGKEGQARTKQLRGGIGDAFKRFGRGGLFGQGGVLRQPKQEGTVSAVDLPPGIDEAVSVPATGGVVSTALEGMPSTATPPIARQTGAPTGQPRITLTDLDTGQVTEPPQVAPRTFMGVPVEGMTPEARTQREITKLDVETRAKVDLARRMLPKLKEVDPSATMDDALAVVGIRTPSATARSMAALRPQSVRGVLADGTPAFGIFDPATRQYINPNTQQPFTAQDGFTPLTAAATQTFGVDREAIAQNLFDRPYRDLSTQERDIVLREEKNMLQEEARRRTLGGGTGRFEAPIDIKTAQETGLAAGVTGPQVAGQVVPTQQLAERRRSVENVRDTLTDIRDRLLVALPKQDELQGLAPGAAYALRRRLPQYRNQIAALEAAINNVVNVMARSVGEQRGTQTERDALRAEAAVAQIRDALLTGDTQESAAVRINESLAVLERILGRLPAPAQPTSVAAPLMQPPPAAGSPRGATVPGAPIATPSGAAPGGTRRRLVQDAAGNWVEP